MSVSFGAVVINTPQPVEHAAFYRELLGWATVHEEPGWVRLRDPARERPGISFQREAADRPPAWPTADDSGAAPMQAHLDLLVDDFDVETERALRIGARLEAHQPRPGVHVMRDPWGHLFCLFIEGA